MYKAIDITRYILWYTNRKEIRVTPSKLHKLLYYTNTTYLKNMDRLLFPDNIEKWRHGPMVTSIFHIFKNRRYGSNLSTLYRSVAMDFIDLIYNHDKEIIKFVIDSIGNYSTKYLIQKTIEEESWIRDKETILGTWDSPVYTLEDLYMSYTIEELVDMKEILI